MMFIRDGFVDVWLYKNCYAKFSTKPFDLHKLDKSIHLTNFAVQKYFMNQADMVPGAVENMWSLSQLIDYFESIGEPDVWKLKIYEGIKKNLLAVILASLETTELNVNNFELNGADFMIGFDYEPILIEINSSPALFLSKYHQEMITNQLLEDLIKVVVDRQSNIRADTGDFELIYTQVIPKANTSCSELTIDCQRIGRHGLRFKRGPRSSSMSPKINERRNTQTMLKFKDENQARPIYFRERSI